MKVKEVAKMLGVSENTVRCGLRENVFPFGTAIKQSDRWTYIIYPELARKYLGEKL